MDLAARHFTFGWRALLVFLTLGLVLESLHGLKVDWYLSTSLVTRRHMWTLAHSHGTLLGLLNLAFAAYVPWCLANRGPLHPWASPALIAASLLLPGGFLLGGVDVRGGDPGLGILLVPAGGLCLLVAVYLCCGTAPRERSGDPPPPGAAS
jgi:hypothetical protein